ncbi:MAG TPA: hypothetical protein H9684_11515 [Firmicutes bacterium]|nr:hypothetical protein [Bacillota bacterium]
MEQKNQTSVEKDDTALLKDIYQDAKMGEETLKTLLKTIESGQIKSDLQAQMAGYAEFYGKAQKELAKLHADPEEVGPLTKASSYLGVKMNAMLDRSPSHVAEMTIQGSTMGIVSTTESLNKHPEAGREAKRLANDVLAFEQRNIERMKTYL